ncbi:MAG: DUF4922 domain-containing protein [Muribaculaceae bacterium]|nr:DUF4922 domain-containing protein [Muribaculaceae bacterium]
MTKRHDIESFIDSQLREWPLAAQNFDALKSVEVKEVGLPGLTFKVQFNPARIVSSGAKVDAAAIKARKCFLCEANRPAEQSGIDCGRYTILVNPFPIFPRHLTIPDKEHTPQRIAGRMADMMRLAEELPGYTVFYNGPRCGASAPDHMHFQAGNSDFLTLPQALESATLSPLAVEPDGSRLALCTTLPVNAFVIDAISPESGSALFDRLLAAMDSPADETDGEPMMNVLCHATPSGVRAIVIPRKRHRPSFYGTEGDGCMLLSPASVDMGGVFITPRAEDFVRIDADVIERTLTELCLDNSEINAIASRL